MIEVINEDYTEDILTLSTVTFEEMEQGVLYQSINQTTGKFYETFYIKTLQDTLVWFENPFHPYKNRVGSINTPNNHGPFIRAPKGTGVLIIND